MFLMWKHWRLLYTFDRFVAILHTLIVAVLFRSMAKVWKHGLTRMCGATILWPKDVFLKNFDLDQNTFKTAKVQCLVERILV